MQMMIMIITLEHTEVDLIYGHEAHSSELISKLQIWSNKNDRCTCQKINYMVCPFILMFYYNSMFFFFQAIYFLSEATSPSKKNYWNYNGFK